MSRSKVHSPRNFHPIKNCRTLGQTARPELCATVKDTACAELWVTHGAEEALVHWAQTQGLAARPLHMIGFGDEDEGLDEADAATEGAEA